MFHFFHRKKKTSLLEEFSIPTAALVLFFLLQAGGSLTELELTLFIMTLSCLLFYWKTRRAELYLYGIGTIVGLLFEDGFRLLGYQQSWIDASLFGIPVWLPMAWGMGFVLVTRIGIYVRGISFDD